MTVEQLIRHLQDVPGETEVWLADEHGNPSWQLVHDDVVLMRDGKVVIETF
jgi:hypothetical protein